MAASFCGDGADSLHVGCSHDRDVACWKTLIEFNGKKKVEIENPTFFFLIGIVLALDDHACLRIKGDWYGRVRLYNLCAR